MIVTTYRETLHFLKAKKPWTCKLVLVNQFDCDKAKGRIYYCWLVADW